MAGPATARDIPILVTSAAASSERRVNLSWTISQLKAKLEPITGIPPSLQTLTVRLPDCLEGTDISAKDEDRTEISAWSLSPYAELHVRGKPLRPFWLGQMFRGLLLAMISSNEFICERTLQCRATACVLDFETLRRNLLLRISLFSY